MTHDKLVEALKWYADQFCEFGRYAEGCGKFDSDTCSGCIARQALSDYEAAQGAREGLASRDLSPSASCTGSGDA